MRAEVVYAAVLIATALAGIAAGLAGAKAGVYVFVLAPIVALATAALTSRDLRTLLLATGVLSLLILTLH